MLFSPLKPPLSVVASMFRVRWQITMALTGFMPDTFSYGLSGTVNRVPDLHLRPKRSF